MEVYRGIERGAQRKKISFQLECRGSPKKTGGGVSAVVQCEQCHLWSAGIQHCCNCGLAQIGSVPLIPGPGTPYVIEGPKKKREKKIP